MQWIKRMVRRVRLVARRSAVERAMDAEFRHHIECEIEDRMRRGMAPAEARRTTLRDFGGIEAVKEQARDVRGGRMLEDLAGDLHYALRVLRHTPGYTATAVLTFALGVGAVTAIFSLVYGILLRPLPYAAPDRLVVVWERNARTDKDRNVVSLDNYEAWRDRARSFDSIAAIVPASVTLPGDPAPERLAGAEVTPEYFGTLGVTPRLGRSFARSDARDGQTVILGDAVWRRRFNADASIVGRAITMSGKQYTVIGVMPPDFDPPCPGWLGQQDLWMPFQATEQSRAWGRFLIVLARLRPGVAIEQARSDMASLAAKRATESPANDGWSASVVSLADEVTRDVRPSLLVPLAGVALLLLMSVANVATLTLAMVRRRAEELALRRAIGATDQRLFRQLFAQSALVGAIGAATGALVAVPGVRLLVTLLPPDIPHSGAVSVDQPVLLVTSLVSVSATIVFGCVAAFRGRTAQPALRAGRVVGDLRTTSRSGGGALLVVEIGLAVALSIMAVLMTRSFAELRAVDLGFAPGGVAVARVALPDSYATPEDRRAFFGRLVERVRGMPGVTAAGVISGRPFGGIGPATTVHDGRRPADPGGRDPIADVRFADAGLFAALGTPLMRPVTLDAANDDGPPRVLISKTLARTVWGDRDPVGQTLALQLFGGIRATVTGVVRDIHLVDARTRPRPVAYLSAARFPDSVCDLVVRVDGEPSAFMPLLRRAATSVDASIPLYAVATLSELVDASLARDRLTMLLLVGFAAVAVLLASVGVYGVFAGDVTTRRKEIGIRLALGARASGILLMLVRLALARTAIGLIAGGLLAAALARLMQSLLFGIDPVDPVSFIAVGLLVTCLAVAATLGPALQALKRSPLVTLREE